MDDVDDLVAAAPHHVDAAPGLAADEALLLENHQRLANRRAAHAEVAGEAPGIEAHRLRGRVEVEPGERVLDGAIGERAQGGARGQGRQGEIPVLRHHPSASRRVRDGNWYTKFQK